MKTFLLSRSLPDFWLQKQCDQAIFWWRELRDSLAFRAWLQPIALIQNYRARKQHTEQSNFLNPKFEVERHARKLKAVYRDHGEEGIPVGRAKEKPHCFPWNQRKDALKARPQLVKAKTFFERRKPQPGIPRKGSSTSQSNPLERDSDSATKTYGILPLWSKGTSSFLS